MAKIEISAREIGERREEIYGMCIFTKKDKCAILK